MLPIIVDVLQQELIIVILTDVILTSKKKERWLDRTGRRRSLHSLNSLTHIA
jgi:hypothetical protein